MPYQDFRQFLDVLRQQGHLIEIERPVALTDVGKALRQAYQHARRPAVMFRRNGTEFPLAAVSMQIARRRSSPFRRTRTRFRKRCSRDSVSDHTGADERTGALSG